MDKACVQQPPATNLLRLFTLPISEFAREGIIAAITGGHPLLAYEEEEGTLADDLASAALELLPPLTQRESEEIMLCHSAYGRPAPQSDRSQRPVVRVPSTVGERRERETCPRELSEYYKEDVQLSVNGVLQMSRLHRFDSAALDEMAAQMQGSALKWPGSLLLMSIAPHPHGSSNEPQDPQSCRKRADIYGKALQFGLGHTHICVDLRLKYEPPRRTAEQFEAESRALLKRIARARKRQFERNTYLNAFLTVNELLFHYELTRGAKEFFSEHIARQPLDEEAQLRVMSLSLTLKDLDEYGPSGKRINKVYLSRALRLYSLER